MSGRKGRADRQKHCGAWLQPSASVLTLHGMLSYTLRNYFDFFSQPFSPLRKTLRLSYLIPQAHAISKP